MTLMELRDLAGQAGVSFRVVYSEAEDSWYGEVTSAAPVECREFKRCNSLSELLDAIAGWIGGLDPTRQKLSDITLNVKLALGHLREFRDHDKMCYGNAEAYVHNAISLLEGRGWP